MNLKRKHSGDDSFTPRCKIFLNEKIVENNNVEKLSKIYEKTHKMLFSGANRKSTDDPNAQSSSKAVFLCGSGEVRDVQTNALIHPESHPRSCSGCLKASTGYHTTCSNCNLELCEFCGYTCLWCRKGICETCIKLYNCGSLERPICDNCSIYQ
ncbi:apoptosis regulatory protein Siva-like [Phlebotomus papatasi]|uniref:apoptosis regulatory protein Siva-like n=1 Tax=Phlebotomus papatasi TaxID=29031 RepID=UPI0024837FAC|nr:apoptosis regulatory protein Siva-like [Phlebotomus papatasi]